MSQPEPPIQPGSLTEEGQQELIQQIGRVIVQMLPPGWQEASVEYRAVGSHRELAAQLQAPNGTLVPLTPPAEIEPMFDELRHGMHQPERGTWISALYQLQRPGSYSVDFNGDYEPSWRGVPTTAEFDAELHHYPRAEHNIPGWLAERAGLPTSDVGNADVTELRKAEVFDGADGAGRPVADRPVVGPQERAQIIEYLERAPIVLAARSYDTDQLDPEAAASVPLTFHTDGDWIWPGAVGYYLRRHNVPPETELVEHIRRQGFQVPEVGEQTRELAVSAITGEHGG
ncbi:hypothetical protein FHX42_001753 [Saccharopolyspora lacisalsi]|uniref:Uncharacterized protein n=1 Tax=Halosaccharopolyspora lacisalsi TaxID=1000566 RepID=A0A839DVZ3_9PSEU|nr:hypothetical protein [Halosaccharopolyspora lacisalsi]MBA8824406.1 hypothetical protein [Halosaccharopolyspora lacisalsi]